MNRLDKIIVVFFLNVFLLPVLGQAAESWGSAMFKEKKFDFGRVAIGSDTVHRFTIKNIYLQDVRLLGIRSSCGCTEPSLTKKVLKSMETAEVVAKFNTSGQHTRDKNATLTLDLETVVDGQVLRDAVQLNVSGYIRPDVVLTPGIVEFGSVAEGKSVVRTMQLEYAGRNDWALVKVERTNPFVHARAEEVKREHGEVAYRVTVTLKNNAPIGYVKDALRFITNEISPGANAPSEIVLPIQGLVMSPIHAKPSPFMVGIVAVGQNVSKNIVVRSDTPFRILGVSSEDKRFRFTFADQESPIQIVSVLFSAKRQEPGPVSDKIVIRTNLPDQEFVTLDALGRLVPPSSETETSSLEPASFVSELNEGVRPHYSMKIVEKEIDMLPEPTKTEFVSSVRVETVSDEPIPSTGGAKFSRPKNSPEGQIISPPPTLSSLTPSPTASVKEVPSTETTVPTKVAFRTPSSPSIRLSHEAIPSGLTLENNSKP